MSVIILDTHNNDRITIWQNYPNLNHPGFNLLEHLISNLSKRRYRNILPRLMRLS